MSARTRGTRSHRITRGLPWLALLALLPVLPAGAAEPGSITLSGTGDRSVVVRLTSTVTLESTPDDLLGGPGRGQLTTPYLGFAVTRLADNQVVAGRIRADFTERTLQRSSSTPLMVDPVLRPGSYRFTLLGRGPQRVVVRTKDLPTSVRWRVGTTTKVRLEAGAMTASTTMGSLVAEHFARLVITAGMFVSYGHAGSFGGVGEPITCQSMNRGEAPGTCLTSGNNSLGSGSGGQYVQPGTKEPGTYQVLWQAAPHGDGGVHGYNLFALG